MSGAKSKRAASPTADMKIVVKRTRVDSQVPSHNGSTEYDDGNDDDDVVFISEQSVNKPPANQETPNLTATTHSLEAAIDSQSITEVTQATPSDSAPINVNGKRIGKYTGDKLVLEADSFVDADGNAVEVTKPAKRMLRLGGRNEGIDGFVLKMPKRLCSRIDITFTSQGCRMIIDEDVVAQHSRADDVNQIRLNAAISEIDARCRAAEEAAPVNEAYQLYIKWRNWVDKRLENIEAMETFPLIPLNVRLCMKANCALYDAEGNRRPLRWNKHCKHDMEKWFCDAAGGYNEKYLEIITSEKDRWDPQQFGGGKEELNEKEARFRKLAGETWKFAYELIDEYNEKRRWGIMD